MADQARAEALRADAEIKAGKYRGPLHGIPYGLKDIFSTKGVPTTWGAADFENRVIDEDAEVAVRLRDAGAVLIAKLATGLFPRTISGFAAARITRGISPKGQAAPRPVRRRQRWPAAWRFRSAPRRRARSYRRRSGAA